MVLTLADADPAGGASGADTILAQCKNFIRGPSSLIWMAFC